MYSYFFVPAYKLANLGKVQNLGVDEIVIDIEDGVKASDRDEIIHNLIRNGQYKEHYIRLPLYNYYSGKRENRYLETLINAGFKKMVFPKLASADDFEKLQTYFKGANLSIIILVETPRLLFEAKDLLLEYKKYFSGIAAGSHDFMNIVGGEHSMKNLEYLRLQVLYLARVASITAIDVASMELKNMAAFKTEITDAVHKGFDAKFFIHPTQIKAYQTMKLYTPYMYAWALKVDEAFKNVKGKKEEFSPIIIDGEIIEKPHLKRAEKILNYYAK